MSTSEQHRPFSEGIAPHGDADEFLEGLRDEQRFDHYAPRSDDWRTRRQPGVEGYPFPAVRERGR